MVAIYLFSGCVVHKLLYSAAATLHQRGAWPVRKDRHIYKKCVVCVFVPDVSWRIVAIGSTIAVWSAMFLHSWLQSRRKRRAPLALYFSTTASP